MRNLVIAFALFGFINRGLGQETTALPVAAGSSRNEHLLKAAEHLEAAGLREEGQRIRQRIDQEKSPSAASYQASPTGDPQRQVLLHVRVIELSQTKLQQLGFSFSRVLASANRPAIESVGSEKTHRLGPAAPAQNQTNPSGFPVLAPNDAFLGVLDALRKDRLAKVLAESTVVTVSNRPGSFTAGGQSRVAVPQGNGEVRIEERPYGSRVDFLPVVLPDRTIHLACRIEVSQLDAANGVTIAGETVPVLDSLNVETTADFKSGHTVVLGGLRQQRRVSSASVAPTSADGTAAKSGDQQKAREPIEEIETLVLLTPEIGAARPVENAARTETRR